MCRKAPGILRHHLLLPFLATLTLLAVHGCRKEDPFRVVTLQVEEEEDADVAAMTLNLFPHIFVPADDGSTLAIPFRPGDLIALDWGTESPVIPILPSDGDTLVFSVSEEVVALGGRPVALDLSVEGGWNWLEQATPEGTQSLRAIFLDDSLASENWALLDDLASHDPTFHLYLETTELLGPLLSIFDPSGLFLEDAEALGGHGEELSLEPELRTLMVSTSHRSDLAFLADMPSLESLMLGDYWDPTELGPLPDSLPKLRSLILSDPEIADLTSLGLQPRLEELIILGCDGNEESGKLDIRGIANLPKLELLALRGCEVADLSPLARLPKLEWLALPPGLDQGQLEAVVEAHPNLTFLELLESEGIRDLTPLTRLADLKGLIIGSGAPPDPLFEMDQLEYLAVMVDEGDDSFGEGVMPLLQAELPTTTIGRVEPFCLGSGLILLLLPMAAALMAFLGRRKKARIPVAGHD